MSNSTTDDKTEVRSVQHRLLAMAWAAYQQYPADLDRAVKHMEEAIGDDAVLRRILADEAIERVIAAVDVFTSHEMIADPGEAAGPTGSMQERLRMMASTAQRRDLGDYGKAVQHMRQVISDDVVLLRTLVEYSIDRMVTAMDAFAVGENAVKLPGQERRSRKRAVVSIGELGWLYG